MINLKDFVDTYKGDMRNVTTVSPQGKVDSLNHLISINPFRKHMRERSYGIKEMYVNDVNKLVIKLAVLD